MANGSDRRCRACGAVLRHVMVDLGMSPLCESYVPEDRLDGMEPFFPLRVFVCGSCFLVQLPEYVPPEDIFSEYAYFSSYSDSWLAHAKSFVEHAMKRLSLDSSSFVVEVASNDGYLLQYFVERGVRVLGVDPAANVAKAAEERGVPTLVRFFGAETAREIATQHGRADLIVGNNVLAQVPDLNDFVAGLGILLAPEGTLTLEFPHVVRLIEEGQFDTIYHEHFSYFSLKSSSSILQRHGLAVTDVEELPTHGGSLRLYVRHAGSAGCSPGEAVRALQEREEEFGVNRVETYTAFEERVRTAKRELLAFLIEAKREGKRIAGYGAPGKGNTLLNYCGIRTDFIDFVVDRNPYKQGKYLPGTHIPILPPEAIARERPDIVLILPWNLRDEIVEQLSFVREWGGKFAVPVPRIAVLE